MDNRHVYDAGGNYWRIKVGLFCSMTACKRRVFLYSNHPIPNEKNQDQILRKPKTWSLEKPKTRSNEKPEPDPKNPFETKIRKKNQVKSNVQKKTVQDPSPKKTKSPDPKNHPTSKNILEEPTEYHRVQIQWKDSKSGTLLLKQFSRRRGEPFPLSPCPFYPIIPLFYHCTNIFAA